MGSLGLFWLAVSVTVTQTVGVLQCFLLQDEGNKRALSHKGRRINTLSVISHGSEGLSNGMVLNNRPQLSSTFSCYSHPHSTHPPAQAMGHWLKSYPQSLSVSGRVAGGSGGLWCIYRAPQKPVLKEFILTVWTSGSIKLKSKVCFNDEWKLLKQLVANE